jgi:hypothetical protein
LHRNGWISYYDKKTLKGCFKISNKTKAIISGEKNAAFIIETGV